jgi:lysophospholipase L1-like esterase
MRSFQLLNLIGLVALGLSLRSASGALAGTNELPLAVKAADPRTYLANLSASLQANWPANHTVQLVCHGHSVPAGYFKTPVVDTFNAYPHLLHRGLKERFPHAVINVIVTAIGGEASESGAQRFERDVLALRPEVVTIDYSLNDRGLGLARAEAAWRSMITNATAHGVKVILLTPTPDLAAKLDDPNDPLNQHAEQVRRLARELGVGLVDSLAAFQRAAGAGHPLPELMSQGNHPNRAGHELVAAELLKWWPLLADSTPTDGQNPKSEVRKEPPSSQHLEEGPSKPPASRPAAPRRLRILGFGLSSHFALLRHDHRH